MDAIFRNGDPVLIGGGGKTVAGHVVMISANQVSVLVEFIGMIGAHAGSMPAMRHDKALGIYRSIIDGTEITLRHRDAAYAQEKENGEATRND